MAAALSFQPPSHQVNHAHHIPKSFYQIHYFMKTTLCFSFLFSVSALADITLVQNTFMGADKTPSKSTMYVKGDKVRTDNDTTTTMIMNTATGDMTTLMHEQKMIMTTNLKQLAALTKQTPAAADPQPVTKITATGQKEQVDGYECEIYTSENKGMVVKMWVAKSYPNQEKLRAEMKVIAKLSAADAAEQPEVPGIALKTEWEQQGMKFSTKLVSISIAPVDESKFALPTDYKTP